MKKILSITFFLIVTISTSYCQDLDSVKKHYLGKSIYFKQGNEFKGVRVIMGLTTTIHIDSTLYPHYETSFRDSIPFKFSSVFSYSDSLTKRKYLCIGVEKGEPGNSFLKLKEISKVNSDGIIYYKLSYIAGDIYTDEDLKNYESKANEELKEKAAKQREIDNPCSRIDYSYDNFHYTKKYNTALDLPEKIADTSYDKYFNAVFYKEVIKGNATYYLSLNTTTSLPDAIRKGVIIILKNGKRINKPTAIIKTDVETVHGESVFVVKSFLSLTPNEISLLKASPLNEFELYVDQATVNHADIVYKMFLCLLAKN